MQDLSFRYLAFFHIQHIVSFAFNGPHGNTVSRTFRTPWKCAYLPGDSLAPALSWGTTIRIVTFIIVLSEVVRTERLTHNLLEDEDLQLLLGEVILVFVKVEEFLWNRVGGRLIIRVVIWLKVGVLQRLLNIDTFDRIER